MKWVLIVIGAIILIPLAVRILLPVIKQALKAIAWLLAVGFGIGRIVMLVQGEILYGIIGLVLAGLIGIFLPKVDYHMIDDYL